MPTFFDNVILAAIGLLRREPANDPFPQIGDKPALFRRYLQSRQHEQLVDYRQRAAETDHWKKFPWEPAALQMTASQGVGECLSWRGLPLFKTVFDVALYPMLIWKLRPATIIELGSGVGASAIWLADLLRSFQIESHVYSADLLKPAVSDPNVTFIEGDCREIESVFPHGKLASLPHPWLVIEDMHMNVPAVLRHFAPHLVPGDYLIVEDSEGKREDLRSFHAEYGANFKVDTYYADFFGRNATCSPDSIFVRV